MTRRRRADTGDIGEETWESDFIGPWRHDIHEWDVGSNVRLPGQGLAADGFDWRAWLNKGLGYVIPPLQLDPEFRPVKVGGWVGFLSDLGKHKLPPTGDPVLDKEIQKIQHSLEAAMRKAAAGGGGGGGDDDDDGTGTSEGGESTGTGGGTSSDPNDEEEDLEDNRMDGEHAEEFDPEGVDGGLAGDLRLGLRLDSSGAIGDHDIDPSEVADGLKLAGLRTAGWVVADDTDGESDPFDRV